MYFLNVGSYFLNEFCLSLRKTEKYNVDLFVIQKVESLLRCNRFYIKNDESVIKLKYKGRKRNREESNP